MRRPLCLKNMASSPDLHFLSRHSPLTVTFLSRKELVRNVLVLSQRFLS